MVGLLLDFPTREPGFFSNFFKVASTYFQVNVGGNTCDGTSLFAQCVPLGYFGGWEQPRKEKTLVHSMGHFKLAAV